MTYQIEVRTLGHLSFSIARRLCQLASTSSVVLTSQPECPLLTLPIRPNSNTAANWNKPRIHVIIRDIVEFHIKMQNTYQSMLFSFRSQAKLFELRFNFWRIFLYVRRQGAGEIFNCVYANCFRAEQKRTHRQWLACAEWNLNWLDIGWFTFTVFFFKCYTKAGQWQ